MNRKRDRSSVRAQLIAWLAIVLATTALILVVIYQVAGLAHRVTIMYVIPDRPAGSVQVAPPPSASGSAESTG